MSSITTSAFDSPHYRIVVVGTSGSGKSTFARRVATTLNIPRVELDALHWESGWVEAPPEVFRERVARAISSRAWIVDGNYGKVRDAVWPQANTLIWLDYPFHIVFGRALYRTLRRLVTRKTLWGRNRETWARSFFSRDSILLWVVQTFAKHKREFRQLLSQPEYSHLKVLRFPAPREAEAYLKRLVATTDTPQGS